MGVFGVGPEVKEAQKALTERGYIVTDDDCFQIDAEHQESFWDLVRQDPGFCRYLATGNESKLLWKPSPLLDKEIQTIEQLLPKQKKADRAGHALDIACGSGRDAVFLALRGCKSHYLCCALLLFLLFSHPQTINCFTNQGT